MLMLRCQPRCLLCRKQKLMHGRHSVSSSYSHLGGEEEGHICVFPAVPAVPLGSACHPHPEYRWAEQLFRPSGRALIQVGNELWWEQMFLQSHICFHANRVRNRQWEDDGGSAIDTQILFLKQIFKPPPSLKWASRSVIQRRPEV